MIDSECVGVFVLGIDVDGANAKCAEIINISVAPKHQKKGIGKELISDAIKLARQLGAQTITVGTGNSSISQLAFYQKCGFRIVGIEFDHFVKNYVSADRRKRYRVSRFDQIIFRVAIETTCFPQVSGNICC